MAKKQTKKKAESLPVEADEALAPKSAHAKAHALFLALCEAMGADPAEVDSVVRLKFYGAWEPLLRDGKGSAARLAERLLMRASKD